MALTRTEKETELRRLEHRNAGPDGGLLHRRRGQVLAATLRLVRLGHDRDDLFGPKQGFQGRHGELRRPHEH